VKTETKPLSGISLLRRLASTGMVPSAAPGVYDAPSPEEIVKAQRVLLDHGYYLFNVKMVEGDFYLFQFLHKSSENPHSVKLRYTTDGVQVPPLALMYREVTEVIQFVDGGSRSTHSTGTSNAEEMSIALFRSHGNRSYFWMPVFDGNPFAEY